MKTKSIFFEDWRDCLRSHYQYVVSVNDHITEPSLRQVLLEAGFTLAEIEEWHEQALQKPPEQIITSTIETGPRMDGFDFEPDPDDTYDDDTYLDDDSL
jgi:hypothetical protein